LTEFFARVSFTRGQSPALPRLLPQKDKERTSLKRTVWYHYAKRGAWIVLVVVACVAGALSQQPATPEPETKPAEQSKPENAKPAAKPPFTLTVKTRPILNISLKAEKAKMSGVAQELSKKLKAPVFVGIERQKELLTIEFSELTLEPALQLLSPTVYVDYEIETGSGGPPRVLGIFFYDANQGEPPLTAVVQGTSQSMLIEGNTEDGVEPETDEEKKKVEEQPLRVSFLNNALSVKAKKQPLPLVLLKIGEELGIPIDIQDQRVEIIDAEISKVFVEDAVRQLAPNIKIFMRADLTRAERRVLRLVLFEPPKTSQQGP
jgi:hypothetical protein